jgi:tetratricopeptide (TPR) repeat protein
MPKFLYALACLLLVACTTPGHLGERRYREGDRRGALATWRQVGESSHEYEAVQRRIADVETEFEQLVVRYEKRAAYYERKGRLAEAALNYRLALEFKSDDQEALARLQRLVRDLAQRKAREKEAFDGAFGRGDLASARTHVRNRETLDPFDAQLLSDERRLRDALQSDVDRLLEGGREQFTAENYEKADAAFVSVLKLDPENGTARGYRSLIRDLVEEGDSEGPSPAPRPALTENQIRAEGFYQNALAAEREGRPYAAIRHDLHAQQVDAAHRESATHLASLRRRMRPEIAALVESGRVYYQQEDLNNALDQWRRVLLIDPGNVKTREYVSRAERLLENLEQLRAGSSAVSSR